MPKALPAALTLPSGKRVQIAHDAKRAGSLPDGVFAPVLALFERGALALTADDAPVPVTTLPLCDFHLVRAVAARSDLIDEEPITIDCHNCKAPFEVSPCHALEIAPWVDDELGDDELDVTLPFGEPVDIDPLPLGRVRTATTVTFAPRTVGEARPLFDALDAGALAITPELVHAMGIVALGPERDPAKIADALATCDDATFAPVGDAFLASHYPLRLGAAVFCEACGARNDVDAPYEREIDRTPLTVDRREGADAAFPDFEAFDARARAIAEPWLESTPGTPVDFVVDGDVPPVDEGGDPIWGSYTPAVPDGFGGTTSPAAVTLYYRTFVAVWEEEGPYDWEAEIEDTVEHELEHHVFALRGHDPKGDEESAEVRDEHENRVGRAETDRRALEKFGQSFPDFVRRAWPLVALGFVALLAWLLSQR